MSATCVGPTFGYHQVLVYEKHFEEEYCCTLNLSRVTISHFSANFILIKKPVFTNRAD